MTKDLQTKYAKIVEWDDEEQCYIGSMPALTGPCASGHDQSTVFQELCDIEEQCVGSGFDLPPRNSHPLLYETITEQCGKFNLEAHRRERAEEHSKSDTDSAIWVGSSSPAS